MSQPFAKGDQIRVALRPLGASYPVTVEAVTDRAVLLQGAGWGCRPAWFPLRAIAPACTHEDGSVVSYAVARWLTTEQRHFDAVIGK